MKLNEIARIIGGECRGADNLEVDSLASLTAAGPNQLTFVANPKFVQHLARCQAAAVILAEKHLSEWAGPAIVCADPYAGYAHVASLFDTSPKPYVGRHTSAIVSADAKVDDSASIGPNCVIERNVEIESGVVLGPGCVVSTGSKIGSLTRLHANVTVYHNILIGKRCTIQSGATLGSDGFGNAWDKDHWLRIPQLGGLKIGNDVQIGANSTIDRGSLEDTVIGDGVVIDNQVQIAHNCRIGDHTGIAGCVGIAGSVEIGSCCTLAGGVGVVDNITITDNVHITTMTLISSSIRKPGVYSSGTGQMPNQKWRRSVARFRQLDNIARRLRLLEKNS